MPPRAKPWPDPGIDQTRIVTPLFRGIQVLDAMPAAQQAPVPPRKVISRRISSRAVNPRSSAVIGTRFALNKVALGDSAAPVLVPIGASVADEWDRQIARVEQLMAASRVRRLVVALPLPGGCYSEVALSRMIQLNGAVSLLDTQAPQPEHPDAPSAAHPFQHVLKEIVDRAGAAVLLAMLGPLLLVVAALIRLTSPGPAFFVQPRLGRHNRVIPVVKFRTMYADLGDRLGGCATVPNDSRVTPLGRVLRRWSVDELPQLLNVLAGHMSLVGPRPHAVMMKVDDRLYFDALPAYLSRHAVKPGITGWAQVNRLSGQIDSLAGGRARLAHDLDYIATWSLWLDLKILAMTTTVFFDRVNRY